MWLKKLFDMITTVIFTVIIVTVCLVCVGIEWVYVKLTTGNPKVEPEIADGDPMMCVINDEEE